MPREKFLSNFQQIPLIAILRGLEPESALQTVQTLVDQGIRIVEVPLNSPHPYSSIERIAGHFGDAVTVGAGTVLTGQEAEKVYRAGGEIALSPGVNSAVIRRTLELGMEPVPGIATPSEALVALEAGARILKVFPAESIGLSFFRHLPAVLPAHCKLLAVGGVDLGNTGEFLRAGAAGVGLGSSLFHPGIELRELRRRAARAVELFSSTRADLATEAKHSADTRVNTQ